MRKNFSKMVTFLYIRTRPPTLSVTGPVRDIRDRPVLFRRALIIILDGDYMVRSSSSSSNFALTVRWNNSSFHFIIIKQGSNWILDDDKIKFESIPSLIEYYVKMKKQVSTLSQALLINPVNALNMQSNSRKIILPVLKNKAIGRVNKGDKESRLETVILDLATLEAIKNEIIAMDTFRLANHIMEAELVYFQTKDDILLPCSHHRR